MATSAVIYARVSTATQDYNRQINELTAYAERMGYDVVKIFSEQISGAKKIAEREAMTELLDYVKSHKVNKVLIYECSRLSRRAVDFLSIVEELNELNVSLYIHQNGLETLQADGKVNPIAQLVLGMMAQFASMERTLIRARMSSGYENYRAKGGRVGRKVGYQKRAEDYKAQYAKELQLLRKGYSLRNIKELTGTSVTTIRKVSKLLAVS